MQAIILAGGKGTRLAERLNGRPKPLVDVDGSPLLKRQLEQLKAGGVTEAIVLVNHKAEQIRDFCVASGGFGLERLECIDDGEPRGTAGAVLAALPALPALKDRFLVVYGDTLFNIDIARMVAAHERARVAATLFLHPNDHPQDSDLVEMGEDGLIVAFHPKPRLAVVARPNLVNAAFYVVETRGLARWRDFRRPSDFGADLFPAMLAAGERLLGYNSFEYIKDLGTPKRLEKAVDHLRRGVFARARLSVPQKCVFLDRDGTLNLLRGYVRAPADLVLLPGAAEAVRRLNEAEFRVALVTNQPVVARGECSFEGLRAIHARLDAELAAAGAYLDRIYVCPHHPHGGYAGEIAALKFACNCRKPATGMIEAAARDLNVDLARSWLVGDSTADMLAASRAGVRGLLVRTGEGGRDGKYEAPAHATVDDIAEAVDLVLEEGAVA